MAPWFPTSDIDPIVLDNGILRVELSARDGGILQIENTRRGIRLVQVPTAGVPWRIEIAGRSEWIEGFADFAWTFDQDDDAGQTVLLRWRTASPVALTVEARVSLPRDDPHAQFSIAVTGAGPHAIDKIEYPILRGIGDLGDEADAMLAHPQATGFLFRRPLDLFETEPLRRQGLRYSPYPEGFSGSTMQFMAYFAEKRGGFYLAMHDPTKSLKWLNVFKGADGFLESTFMHQAPEIAPGERFAIPVPVLIGALFDGTWYEAAERYKAWAIHQPWTAQGTLADRNDTSGWLLDEVGFATFGINAAHDRSAWLDRFHAITGEPVFHVLGVNWPKTTADYRNHFPGGRDDWFPARFSAANLETIRRNGDYWAPFEFDLLLDPEGTDGERIRASLVQIPEETYSFDRYRFPYQCPAAPYLPELHRWRDERLAGTYGADALYYDISASNLLMTCRNPEHGHPVGGGGWMVDACAAMWERTGEAASAARGQIVPQGTEMISEVFIPQLDYYQARAEAGPLSTFEADVFRDWIRQGAVEKIPLFAYVYHEYGPVRLDGWGKLSPEVGELFYWVAGRVALWGGLFELNDEFSQLENLAGQDDDPAEHYYAFERRGYEVDPAKVAFVREIAIARTGFARPYLVYGSMRRPLDIAAADIELDYHLYNLGREGPHYDERGTMRVPNIVHATWRAMDGTIGFLFVNLRRETVRSLSLEIDPARYEIELKTTNRYSRITGTERAVLAEAAGPVSLAVTLQPRQVTLVEMTPHAP